jgi:hypothetical protein
MPTARRTTGRCADTWLIEPTHHSLGGVLHAEHVHNWTMLNLRNRLTAQVRNPSSKACSGLYLMSATPMPAMIDTSLAVGSCAACTWVSPKGQLLGMLEAESMALSASSTWTGMLRHAERGAGLQCGWAAHRGLLAQRPAQLLEAVVALAAVARHAGGHHVVPAELAALRRRLHVVQREVRPRAAVPAHVVCRFCWRVSMQRDPTTARLDVSKMTSRIPEAPMPRLPRKQGMGGQHVSNTEV